MNAEEENKIQELFSDLRRMDEVRVPSFNRVARAETAEREAEPGFSFSWMRLAAGATALVAAILLLTTFQEQPAAPAVDAEQWTAISTWCASTDSLLTSSSDVWGRKISTTTDAWIQPQDSSSTNDTQQEQTL